MPARRARVLDLKREEPINESLMAYVNRLSDHLFVQSRWVLKRLDEPEYLWDRGPADRSRQAARGEA